MNNELNFTQELTLPSQGLLNPEIPGGAITQRCMMVKDQKILASTNKASSNALQQLLQATTVAPETFDVSNLTLSDTLYLLFKLRMFSYGDTYTFRTKCPECGKKINVSIDLSDLPVNTLEEGFQDELEVTLPNRKDVVYTKLLTNRELEEISKEAKRRKKKNPEDESEYILRIVYSIVKIKLVNEKKELTHPIDIERYIETLTDMDASAIIATRDSVKFGIDPIFETTCPECDEEIEIGLQFSGDFFRPSFNK